MGVPEFRVRPILRANRVQVFYSNYALYADMSARVMATLAGLCPEICQYSIDEAFIPLCLIIIFPPSYILTFYCFRLYINILFIIKYVVITTKLNILRIFF